MSGRLDVQFLSVNHNKFVPYSNSYDGKMKKPHHSAAAGASAASSSPSAPRSSKSLHAFDLSSILDQLPPNTGPAGTVVVNGGTGSLNNSNKNLSHVPCKFYRQGVCQAGNSCPFSHNLDGTLAADRLPCKYFQKGNCKFGLKCALAHFLPDGTRVNSKSLLSYRRNNDRSDRSDRSSYFSNFSSGNGSGSPGSRNGYNGGNSNQASSSTALSTSAPSYAQSSYSLGSTPASSKASQPINISANSLSTTPNNGAGGSYGFSSSQYPGSQNSASGNTRIASSPSSIPPGTTSGPSLAPSLVRRESGSSTHQLGASAFSTYNGSDWLSNHSSNLFTPSNTNLGSMFASGSYNGAFSNNSPPNFAMSSPVGSEPTSANTTVHSPQAQLTSLAYAKSFSRYQASTSSSPQYNYTRSESAFDDDDSEENYDNDDNAFFEDFVPASLGNLILTPQERQRRSSRSQSGTLLARPNLFLTPTLEKRIDKLTKLAARNSDDVFLMD